VTKKLMEVTRREFRMQLSEVEAQAGRGGFGNTATEVDMIKPPEFNGPMFWILFYRQFEAMVEHNNWTVRENVTHLLVILQGQAFDVLHSVPVQAGYEDIIEALEGHYWDHQLTTAYHSQLRARTQLSCMLLQEFAAITEQSSYQALVGLPQYFVQNDIAFAFVYRIRDER
jgi:hypothetical protein